MEQALDKWLEGTLLPAAAAAIAEYHGHDHGGQRGSGSSSHLPVDVRKHSDSLSTPAAGASKPLAGYGRSPGPHFVLRPRDSAL